MDLHNNRVGRDVSEMLGGSVNTILYAGDVLREMIDERHGILIVSLDEIELTESGETPAKKKVPRDDKKGQSHEGASKKFQGSTGCSRGWGSSDCIHKDVYGSNGRYGTGSIFSFE